MANWAAIVPPPTTHTSPVPAATMIDDVLRNWSADELDICVWYAWKMTGAGGKDVCLLVAVELLPLLGMVEEFFVLDDPLVCR